MPLTIISKISLYSCLVIQVPTINYDKMNIMQVHTIGQQSNDIKTKKNDILRSKVNIRTAMNGSALDGNVHD